MNDAVIRPALVTAGLLAPAEFIAPLEAVAKEF